MTAFPDEELPAVSRLFKPLLLSCALLIPCVSHAADAPKTAPAPLKLLSSSGFMNTMHAIAPDYEKTNRVKLTVKAPSTGAQTGGSVSRWLRG
ncbi:MULTISPECIES: hypothetical protein [unclassified Pseudomonas]|uniref:hypothetical protein n=1 Tax=unclassified Pseudomonas TaxID=196821 RepID=UPI002B230413|nr:MULTISPECIES: hypothetical protein [unclassified Pseudomonas]MEA9977125.1 hypothetical protein [Pseudomonas sp. RTS4]MEB0196911.1 hypothetical protein [Pseudomonas sp. 5S4]MEB0245856.1 hypothetical protein [Pseudomonas sp. 10S5]